MGTASSKAGSKLDVSEDEKALVGGGGRGRRMMVVMVSLESRSFDPQQQSED